MAGILSHGGHKRYRPGRHGAITTATVGRVNHLAHLYLADMTGTSPAGALLGDVVKGRLRGQYPPAIELGIALHRRIDCFTDAHPAVTELAARFDPPYRRYAGIMLDVYFDHLLAREWNALASESLPAFSRRIAGETFNEWPHSPFTRARMAGFAERLAGYRQLAGVERALAHVDARARRATPLRSALTPLRARDVEAMECFEAFFPGLQAFALNEVQRLRSGD